MKTRFAFLLILIPLFLTAQEKEPLVINGSVVEFDGQKPVEGAVCFLKNNEFIGNVTDRNGRFTIVVPRTLSSDTLVISNIGYSQILMTLNGIGNDTTIFVLHRRSIMLDDVLVEAEGDKLGAMVLRAYANFPKNCPDRIHQLKGLYRKLSTEQNAYTHLEEAVMTVQDYAYKKERSLIKVKLDAYRQTEDLGNIDTVSTKVYARIRERAAAKTKYNYYNAFYDLYKSNHIRAYKIQGSYFNYTSLKENIDRFYSYDLMNVEVIKNDTIYQIAFSDLGGINNTRPSGNTYLKINSSNNAIVEYQVSNGSKGDLFYQAKVIFKEVENRYYPHFIKVIKKRMINRDYNDGEYDISTFWFDEIVTHGVDKIRPKNVLSKQYHSQYKNEAYSYGFWSHTEFLKNHPLEEVVRGSLEFEKPLEDQLKSR